MTNVLLSQTFLPVSTVKSDAHSWKNAEGNDANVTCIFTESGHGKGRMGDVGGAFKNSIDNAMTAAESMSNISVCCEADVVLILNLVNTETCLYNIANKDKTKEILPGSNSVSISCKKCGISKLHESIF